MDIDNDAFSDMIERYVIDVAGGSKTKAARLLNVPRLQIYRYLAGGAPRSDIKRRLVSIIRASRSSAAAEAGRHAPTATNHSKRDAEKYISVSLMLRMIQSLEQIVQEEVGRDVASHER